MSGTADNGDDLHDVVNDLRQRVAELEDTIDDLRDDSGGTTGGGIATDPRDAAVLERLDPPTAVGRGKLESLYRAETDIRNKKTLKRRIRSLTDGEAWENVAPGKWVYRGDGDE